MPQPGWGYLHGLAVLDLPRRRGPVIPPEPNKGAKAKKGLTSMEAVPRKTTIREVAQAASVGIGTISRVLNSSSQVSRETRARVLEAIRRLGFRPNAQARSEEHTSELRH